MRKVIKTYKLMPCLKESTVYNDTANLRAPQEIVFLVNKYSQTLAPIQKHNFFKNLRSINRILPTTALTDQAEKKL